MPKLVAITFLLLGLSVIAAPDATASIQQQCRCAPTGIEWHPNAADHGCIQKAGSIQGC